jgi:hypothetical protein
MAVRAGEWDKIPQQKTKILKMVSRAGVANDYLAQQQPSVLERQS